MIYICARKQRKTAVKEYKKLIDNNVPEKD